MHRLWLVTDCTLIPQSEARFSQPDHIESAAHAAFKGGDAGFDFDDWVADGFEAEAAVGLGEDFAFDDAGVVADRDELHLVAGDLMMRAVGDDEAADGDALAGITGEVADAAIGFPRDAGELIERMTAHGEAEQFHFVAQTLRAIRLRKRNGGQRGIFVALEKETLRVRPLREVLQLPELRGARLAEAVERADADEVQHFGGAGIHAVVEIAQ